MSNRNYNEMYTKTNAEAREIQPVTEEISETMDNPITEIQEVINEVVETVEPVIEPAVLEVKNAVVTNCQKLNVRKHPDPEADVVATINVNEEVAVSINESVDNYYRVCTVAGIEGYCVKDYLQLK